MYAFHAACKNERRLMKLQVSEWLLVGVLMMLFGRYSSCCRLKQSRWQEMNASVSMLTALL